MLKNRILSHPLFDIRPAKGKAFGFWLLNWGVLMVMCVGVTGLSLLLGLGDYPLCVAYGFFTNPLIFLLNALPVMALVSLLYLATGRSWLGFVIGGGIVLVASVGNYFKLLFRDDPFMFSDVTAIGTALKISGRYDVRLDLRIGFCIFCFLLAAALLFFFCRGRIGGKGRIIGIVIVLALVYPMSLLYSGDDIYNKKTENYTYINRWSSTQLYISKGYIYPFLHSVKEAFPEKPEGYSEKKAEEILSGYKAEDIPADKKVDIIAIQLEAYNDLESMGFEDIDPSVYAPLHQLQEESVSGRLITNIFAGGTIDTEREFITGDTDLINFRGNAGSYAWYLKEQGYATTGSHSCYGWFYNRQNVNAYLGFDSYYYYENRYSELADGQIAPDDILLPDILELYGQRDTSSPYFSFCVTYQGHGPYPTDALDWQDICWEGACDNEDTYYILNNYLAGIKNTGENLIKLTEELEKEASPVVLVVFGDHNPWLGNANSVYEDLGIDLDTSTQQGYYNYYCTPYFIWGNSAAKETLGRDLVGQGEDISPCFLMNEVFDICGLGKGNEYMQLMESLRESGVAAVGSITGMYVENGVLTEDVGEQAKSILMNTDIARFYRYTHNDR